MFEVLVLLLILRRRWQGAHESALAQTVLKTVVASLVMALVIVVIDLLWTAALPSRALPLTMARLACEGLLGLATFILVAWALKMRELVELRAMLLGRAV